MGRALPQGPGTADARECLLPDGLVAALGGAGAVRVNQHAVWSLGAGVTARLAVAELGPEAAPAWVLAHGVGSSARFVAAAFAAPVLAAGGRLVVYDLRGHGSSDAAGSIAQHHLDVHAGDLAAVTEAVAGPLAVVGGVSLGGHAAVRAVVGAAVGGGAGAAVGGQVDRCDAVLVCLPAWTGAARAGHGPHAAIAAEVERVGVCGMVQRLRGETGLPGWLRDTLLVDYPRHDPASLAAALRSLDGGHAPTLEEVGRLAVPLAVVGWPDDPGHPIEVAETWSRAAATSALEVIDIAELEAGVTRFGSAGARAVLRAVGGAAPC